MSLRWKMIFSFFLLSSIPLLLAIFIMKFVSSKEIVKQVTQDLQAISKVQSARVSEIFDRFSGSTRLVASRTQMRISFKDYLETKNPKAIRKVIKIIKDARRSTSGVEFIGLLDLKGELVASVGIKGLNLNKSKVGFHFFKNGSDVFVQNSSDLILNDELIGKAIVVYNSYPLLQVTGDYTGLGKSGETIVLLKQNGNFINLMPLRFQKNSYLKAWKKDFSDDDVLSFSHFNDKYQVSILVKKDKEEVVGALKQMTYFALILFIVFAVIIFIVTKILTNPINKLAKVSKAIIEGQSDYNLDTKGNDEISLMARSLEQVMTELKETKDKLEETLEYRTEFFANMSHEIRTPLNGIIGFSDLILEEKDLPKEIKSNMELIKNCGDSLLMIINDILDVSKMEAGKLQIDEIAFDLDKVIESAVSIFGSIAQKKKLTLNYSLARDVPEFVIGDPLRIRQVLLNLIGNAVKFTGENGKVDIRVVKTGSSNDKVNLTFSVQDSGIGISEENTNKLFQSFEQLDTGITREYGGSGLGLFICANLVSMMGGDIDVESEEGIGSTFNFYLELEIATNVDSFVQYDEEDEDLNKYKVLIAEDNPMNQLLATKVLKKMGYENIEKANNGVEAIEAVKKDQFDIILMDVQMPMMGGLEATKIIRGLQLSYRPMIIGLSANAFEEDKEIGLSAGMDDYLGKPFKKDALVQIIKDQRQRNLKVV